jgi:hypothetical protein
MSAQEKPPPPKKRRRPLWRKKRAWLGGFVVAALAAVIWLDGPGWRWIAHKAADHYLPKLGYEASFTLEGRLSSGEIRVTDLRIASDEMVRGVDLESLAVRYRLGKVVKGEIEALQVRGLDATIDLAAAPPKEEPDEPGDLRETLDSLRGRLLPVDLDLEDIALTVLDGDETLYQLDPTTLRHAAGAETFSLDLGAMTLPGGRVVPAQTARLDWSDNALDLDRLDLLDGVGVRQLRLVIPDTGPPEIRSDLVIADGRFALTTDLETGTLEMTESDLTAAEINTLFGLDLPLAATLKGLKIDASGLKSGPDSLTTEIAFDFASAEYDGWLLEDARLTATLDGPDATVSLRAVANGSPLELDLKATLDRADHFLPVEAEATLVSPRVAPMLTYVRDRYAPGDDRPDPPAAARLRLTATARDFENGVPDDTAASLRLEGGEGVPSLQLDATWKDRVAGVETLRAPGLRIGGRFTPETLTYAAELEAEAFSPESLVPWLAPFGIGIPAGMTASLAWSGEGDIEAKSHRGTLDLERFFWKRGGDVPPIEANARGAYAWPETVDLESLVARAGAQRIETRLALADQVLALTELRWHEGDTELADGYARIPVPEDLGDWRALLRETRDIDVRLETPELPLAKLHPFLPETARFTPDSRGRVELSISGSPAEPVLDAKIRGRQIALVSPPDLPPADLALDALGRGQTLKITGGLTLPGYPPAAFDLQTVWDPQQWADDPETVRQAKLDGTLNVRNFNLAALSRFVPKARKLGGTLEAEVDLGGTVGEPEPRATLTLRDGLLRMKDSPIPPIRRGTLDLVATPERIELTEFSAVIAGGSLRVSGQTTLDGTTPGPLDLRLVADSLPALRNDSVIVRVSSELTLTGPWESARLAGRIDVVDSLFYKDFEILPIGAPTNQVSRPKLPRIDGATPAKKLAALPAPFRDWALDLDVATQNANPFLIRGNLARGEIYLDAEVKGTLGSPRPSGTAVLREVTAKLPFSTLEIQRGEVRFRPNVPFDPLLDLRGRSMIRPYEINLYITGPVSNPNIQPSSNPPLPQSEIFTLLATGTTTEGMEDPQAAAARAAQLFIEELRRGRIGAMRGMRPVFRVLDKVNFQVGERNPYTSETYNSATFELDEDWQLSAGLSEDGNTRTTVTYLFRFR